jgi:hypothetical protein
MLIVGYVANWSDWVGWLPSFLHEEDPACARDQFDRAYQHGGGWRAFDGFVIDGDTIQHPGDPALEPVAEIHFRDERIIIYPGSWVRLEVDGKTEIARMN